MQLSDEFFFLLLGFDDGFLGTGLITFGLSEYVLVSLALALIIAVFFPAVHNTIVPRASARLGYKSLYWGTAVVSNVFIYGLVFALGRGLFIIIQYLQLFLIKHFTASLLIVPCIQEVVVHVILFVGALIASLGNEHGVPIPNRGVAKIVINISFCLSCFCCCVCCSSRCRAKTTRILVLFSFMSFVYQTIMDTISIVFVNFLDESVAFFIVMYISLLVYLLFSVSYSLFIAFQNGKLPLYRQCISCLGSMCMLVTVFSAVIIIFAMYIYLYTFLKPSGLNGIVAGLLPSVALSAVSWYIKKKLLSSSYKTPVSQLEYGTTCVPVNGDGEGKDPAGTGVGGYCGTLIP